MRTTESNETPGRIRPDYEALSCLGAGITLRERMSSRGRSEGNFASVYRGQSLEFEDLRNYTYGDSLRDVDWKATSRTGELIVRNYTAYRRRQIIMVPGTGLSMAGSMPDASCKREGVLLTAGTAAYLAGRAGADYMFLQDETRTALHPVFGSGPVYLERYMEELQSALFSENENNISNILKGIMEMPVAGACVCIISDLQGLTMLDADVLRMISSRHLVYVFELMDVDWGGKDLVNGFTMLRIPELLTRSRKISEEILRRKKQCQKKVTLKLKQCGACFDQIWNVEEIPLKVVRVLNG
jgi:uncharacterized protein (DUF58 family)